MRYSKEEKIDIGRQVYTHELSRLEAITKYQISHGTMDVCVRLYKEKNGIPLEVHAPRPQQSAEKRTEDFDIEAYKAMSKEELINELIKAKANELRAKKGYEVKGDGVNKEFIPLNNRNSKS